MRSRRAVRWKRLNRQDAKDAKKTRRGITDSGDGTEKNKS
jgi:hypothetical protein